MLQLVIGRSGSGKTAELYRRMRDTAANTVAPIVLLVPEQASFDNERRLLTEFGPVLSQRVSVLSFTRLADTVFRQVGGIVGKRMDATLSLLLMRQALTSIADSLDVYRRQVDNPDYLASVLDFYAECKQNRVTPVDLETVATALPAGVLRQKTEETALIFGAYEALVTSSHLVDPQDDLTVLCDRLPSCTAFDGAHLYIDSFKGFTKQELEVLDRLMPHLASMTVALCTDTVSPAPRDLLGRFSTAAGTARRLQEMARDHHLTVNAPLHLTQNLRTADPALQALEAGCFTPTGTVYEQETASVCVKACADRAEECRFAARQIRRLLREDASLHCRDFTVVVRDADAYVELLQSALRREELPCTVDVREPVLTQPLITLIESALAAALRWDSADVLRLLKTDLTGFSVTSASLLENYVFLWDIRGKQWKLPFTAHPDGMDKTVTPDSERRLAYLELLRRRLTKPLVHLQTRLSGNRTGREFAEAIWQFLQESKTARLVRLSVARLKAAGELHAAEQQARMWDYVMALLDKFAALTTPTTAAGFADLFRLAVSGDDLGSIPPTLDGVHVGSADRIRYTAPKTVLILGANEGVFPAYPSSGALLGHRERQRLSVAGLQLSNDMDTQTADERYYAYAALAAPTERLIVTYAQKAGGETLQPSTLVDTVRRLIPNRAQTDCDEPESASDAFRQLSATWREATVETASLRAVFDTLPAYADRLASLRRSEKGFVLEDKNAARQLFGNDLSLSPTQIEDYHKCRFAHYCKYGLSLNPRKRATLDGAQAGTLAHELMATLLPQYAKNGYACTRSSLHTDIEAAVLRYVEERLGGLARQDDRFRGLLTELTRYCEELMWRVVCELRQSRFVPVDYELSIGYPAKNRIPAWTLTTPDGTNILVNGKVDRVDVFRDGKDAFVRVIDYKTYNMKFALAEVLGGLELQMLIYLFAICASGSGRYGELTPAGVLYLPAQLPVVKATRDTPADKLETMRLKTMKANGLLIDNREILQAMEVDLAGIFIPATATQKGFAWYSTLATLEQFGHIRHHIERLLIQMATELHNGAIDVCPTSGLRDGCQYCKYADMCCFEEGDPTRELPSMKLDEALEQLRLADEGGDAE